MTELQDIARTRAWAWELRKKWQGWTEWERQCAADALLDLCTEVERLRGENAMLQARISSYEGNSTLPNDTERTGTYFPKEEPPK